VRLDVITPAWPSTRDSTKAILEFETINFFTTGLKKFLKVDDHTIMLSQAKV